MGTHCIFQLDLTPEITSFAICNSFAVTCTDKDQYLLLTKFVEGTKTLSEEYIKLQQN
jgi:hypothetical protein